MTAEDTHIPALCCNLLGSIPSLIKTAHSLMGISISISLRTVVQRWMKDIWIDVIKHLKRQWVEASSGPKCWCPTFNGLHKMLLEHHEEHQPSFLYQEEKRKLPGRFYHPIFLYSNRHNLRHISPLTGKHSPWKQTNRHPTNNSFVIAAES